MSQVVHNIKSLRKKHQYTQEQFAQKLGIKRSLLGAYEEGRAKPRLDILMKAASLFDVSVEQLIGETMADMPMQSSERTDTATTGGNSLLMPVRLLTKAQQKAYFSNRDNSSWLSALPVMQLPLPVRAKTVCQAFEMADSSMLPLAPGTVVIGQREENLQYVRNGQLYVLITRDEMLLRRVYNRIAEEGNLRLETLHGDKPPTLLPVLGKEVEAWEVISCLTTQLPSFADVRQGAEPMDLKQLTQLVLQLQQEVYRLKDKD